MPMNAPEARTDVLDVAIYSPADSRRFWAQHPGTYAFLSELDSREMWVTRGACEAQPKLSELLHAFTSTPCPPAAAIAGIVRILAALPFAQAVHALLWMDRRDALAVREVARHAFDCRGGGAAAGILWGRLECIARHHVTSGLINDVTEEWSREAIRRADTPDDPEQPTRRRARTRRLCVLRNEETLPFLEEFRAISSLNEVDELFGKRRFYLLTEDLVLCRSLAPCGVGVDQYGGYVTRGPACDFERLDPLLPLVARRSIKPLFGDLTPRSCSASTLSRLLTRASWDRLCRPVLAAKGHRCEICGAKDEALDCHENWEFHEPTVGRRPGVQKLLGLWVMCKNCHATQHLAQARSCAEALERLRRIGRMSEREAQAYRAFVFERRERRSRIEWLLDVSRLRIDGPLIVQSAWSVDAAGLLRQTRQLPSGETAREQTGLLGASWRLAGADSCIYPARPVEEGYYE